MKCIYCLEGKPVDSFRKTEHVLPQSFGKFKDNLTLNKIVCDTCNEYFGNNLELHLGRDSFEGMARFDHNVKRSNEFRSPGKESRLSIKLNEGPLKGAYAYREYSELEGKIIIKPIPQVGFKRSGGPDYEYFPLDRIPDKDYLESNFDLKAQESIRTLGASMETAQKHFIEKGISFNPCGEGYPSEPHKDWECEVTGQIDQAIFRSIAKIAFNYLAYWAGPDFVIESPFHPIRKYIRYGEKTSYPFVVILDKSILRDEPVEGKRRLGHIIVLAKSRNGLSVVSQVSLFNWATYSVVLAKDYHGKQFAIEEGRFFNVANGEILELVPGDMAGVREHDTQRRR